MTKSKLINATSNANLVGPSTKVVLCASKQMIKDPKLMGLTCESQQLLSYEWLNVYFDGGQARKFCANNPDITEAWIVSAEDVDAINLAAALKKDNPKLVVCVLCFELSGSLKSRANQAQINTIFTVDAFAQRFCAYAKTNVKIHAAFQTQTKINTKTKTNAKTKTESKPVTKIDKLESMGLGESPSSNTITSSTDTKVIAPNESKAMGFLMPVVSATGGSGKSVVSVMAATLSQLAGYKTILVDSNLQFSEIVELVDSQNTFYIDELLGQPEKLLNRTNNEIAPTILAAPKRAELAEAVMPELPGLIKQLRTQFDVVVVNTCNYWNELTASLLENASKSIVLVDQRPTAIAATKSARDLCARCGIATSSFLYAVNRCKKGALYSAVDISCVLDGASVAEIDEGGLDVDNCFVSKRPLTLIENKNPFTISVWNIICSILPNNGTLNAPAVGTKKSRRNKKKRA